MSMSTPSEQLSACESDLEQLAGQVKHAVKDIEGILNEREKVHGEAMKLLKELTAKEDEITKIDGNSRIASKRNEQKKNAEELVSALSAALVALKKAL
eukprot:CAMPEP_0113891802 /NCGR_PEP_ID=MMETSP0780_2-20120614/14993_1 /TAXON_ID=652834 /ORGANISM="Palpitomonas bilix" /LENGTH=97 /DNA_ID=CAMNT_0000881529 /DNA_START=28 /DNA_END=321 /DNA_ORIENTATION=+ /assembly_acc=CAM_ASM_000599